MDIAMAAKGPSGLEYQQSLMSDVIAEMVSVVDDLRSRLSPILLNSSPESSDVAEKSVSNSASVNTAIGQRQKLSDIITELRDISRRIDL